MLIQGRSQKKLFTEANSEHGGPFYKYAIQNQTTHLSKLNVWQV